MNLFVNVQANIANFMAGMAQIKAAVQATNQQLGQMGGAGAAGVGAATSNLMQLRNSLVGATAAVGVLAAAFDSLTDSMVSSFRTQEAAFAGIRKTINATEEQFQDIKAALTDFSNRAPVKFEDLAKISELAGQLGVRGVDNITKFTETIARVAVSTNLTTEAAATAFARLSNIMQEPIENVDKVASAVVGLGNNFATTEAEIVNFAMRIAGAGKIANLATSDILGIGAALSSVGVKAESGGTAVQKMLIEMSKSVATNSENLKNFAKLAGETQEDFKTLFNTKPAEAFTKVVEGLGQAGDKAFVFLEGLVGENARFLRSFLSLANAGDLLRKAMENSGVWIKDTTQLMNESDRRFATFDSTVKTMTNTINNFAAALGETLMPILRPLAKAVSAAFEAFQALPAPIKTIIALTIAVTAAFLSMMTAVLGAVAIWAALAAAFTSAGIALIPFITTAAVVIGSIIALGLAVTAVIKIFNLFSANTYMMAQNTQKAGEAAKESSTGWQALGDAFVGLGISIMDVWTVFKNFVVDIASATWGIFKDIVLGLGEAFNTLWEAIMPENFAQIKTTLKEFFSGLIDQIFPISGAIKAIGDAFEYFRAKGQAAREFNSNIQAAEKAEAALHAGEMLSIAKKSKSDFDVLGEEEYKEQKRRAQQQMDLFIHMQSISDSVSKFMQVTQGKTDREILEEKKENLRDLENAQELFFATEMDLATRAVKDSKKKQDEVAKAQDVAQTKVINERLKLNTELAALQIKENQEVFKAYSDQAKVATESYQSIMDSRQKMSEDMRRIDMTDAERTIQGFRDEQIAAGKAIDDWIGKLTDAQRKSATMAAEIADAQNKPLELFNAKLKQLAETGLRQATNELKGTQAALGLLGEEAYQASAAFTTFGKAYQDLEPWQKNFIDQLAKATYQINQAKAAMDIWRLAGELTMAGMEKNAATALAAQVHGIEMTNKYMNAQLDAMTKVNEYAQKSEDIRLQILEQGFIQEGKLLDFSLARLKRYAVEQDTIWVGIGKLIVSTFDNVQKSLSDVFFNLFTGQSFKLADVWKNLLNSMARDLANFLASSAVKGMLMFIGNMLTGQSPGTAAGGALSGLLGGASGLLGGAAGSASTSTSGGGGLSSILSGVASGGGVLSGLAKFLGFGGSTPSPSGNLDTTYSAVQAPQTTFSIFSPLAQSGSTFSSFDVGNVDTTSGGYQGYDFSGDAYATGGRVPGSGRGDIVPAMLEPGEFVVRRDVAQSLGPLLDTLNGPGGGAVKNGKLWLASGGQVDLSGVSGMSGADIQSLAFLQYILSNASQQTQLQQQIAQNTATGASAGTSLAKAVGAPVSTTAGTTTTSGSGGQTTPQTAGGSNNTSLTNALALTRSGVNLAGLAAKFGLQAGGAGRDLQLGIGGGLNTISGGLGLAQGILSGNTLGAIGGGFQGAAGLAQLGTSAGLLGNTLGGALSGGFGLGGGILGLIQSIKQGSPTGIISNAYSTYSGIASLANAFGGTNLPTIGGALGSLFGGAGAAAGATIGSTGVAAGSVFAPAASLGATAVDLASLGATGLELGAAGAGGAAGAAGAAVGTVAGAAGFAALPALAFAAFGLADMFDTSAQGFSKNVQNTFGAVPGVAGQIQRSPSILASITPQSSVSDIQAAWNSLQNAQDNLQNSGVENLIKSGGTLTGENTKFGLLGGGENYSATYPNIANVQAAIAPGMSAITIGRFRLADLAGSKGSSAGYFGTIDYAKQFAPQAFQDAIDPWRVNSGGSTDPGHLVLNTATGLTEAIQISQAQQYTYDNIMAALRAIKPGTMEQSLADLFAPYGGYASPFKDIFLKPDGNALREPIGFTPEQQHEINAQTMGTPEYAERAANQAAWLASPTGQEWQRGIEQQNAAMQNAWMSGGGGDGGMQTGGWVPGTSTGRDSVPMLLEPGEYVIPRQTAQNMKSQLGAGGSGLGGGMQVTINITVEGNVDDPQELAQRLAPMLRDELRRIDPRYSRAGNKVQV